ncbi:RHS repeat domain-containing protein [Flavobacterium eburneipallidum]|uniref:RHS repeat domain-containing protein n=1 Tax=Flavobacterium eburneipallidum TaxID=3003263 RepID=UPI0022AC6A5B|nr:RHS repeat domain-containing protein [Flavobacterium eburneipallidum]
MKFRIFIPIYFLSISFLFSQTNMNEYYKKNKICEVKILSFFGNETRPKNIQITKYDSKGNEITSLIYNDNNKLLSKFEFQYDSNNSKTITIENGKKDLYNELHYKYDFENKIIEQWSKSFSDKFYYDLKNKIYKIIHTNKSKNETKEILFKYDEKGNKLAEYVDGNPFHINQFYKYNDNNQIIEEENFYHLDGKDKLYNKFLYLYDENKRLISKNYIDGYSKENDVEYSYDKFGNVTTINVKGESLTTNFYNQENLITKKEITKLTYDVKIIQVYQYNICK